jgi:ABC-2 type transport system ATP-binding protein
MSGREGFGVTDLRVRYGGHTAVEDLTFTVPAGTVAALVGGDGAGKTSVLRALAGAIRPAGGSVRRPDPRRIGYMPAGEAIYRDLTVEENLAFSASAYGVRGVEGARRAAELLERTGLGAARGRLGGQLSGGMRHKLALAMALLHQPQLLVLDEPTTGVDPVSRAELWLLIASAAAADAAVVLATCYVDEAERAASVVVLSEGRPLLQGPPEEVIACTPGAVVDSVVRLHPVRSWRRGARWRTWSPDGTIPPGATRAELDLEDAVIVAELARLRHGTGEAAA